jgi:putative ABC transport system substrate-binding protein
MKRREFLPLLGSVAIFPGIAEAQDSSKPRRIGLMAGLNAPPIEAFRKKLRELGYEEGKNLVIEYRFAQGRDNPYQAFAEELVAMPVEVIVVWGTPNAFAAKRATTTIPILIGAVGDAVNVGLVTNLARPEANVTGFIALNVDLEEKRLELLKEVVPHLSRVGILANSSNPLNRVNLETAQRVARPLGVKLDIFEVKVASDVPAALEKLVASRPDAALMASDLLLLTQRKIIAEAMSANRIPAIYPFREYAEAGGLFIYGANLSVLFERAAGYLDRLLKGAKPSNLPVQQATAFELIVNLKAASALGLTIPPNILVRADEVIE